MVFQPGIACHFTHELAHPAASLALRVEVSMQKLPVAYSRQKSDQADDALDLRY